MICPTCDGKGKVYGFGHLAEEGRCRPASIPCPDCGQTGKVDDRCAQWKGPGDRLKDARIARRETLRAFCKRTGVDPSLRSRQERGLTDPTGVEP